MTSEIFAQQAIILSNMAGRGGCLVSMRLKGVVLVDRWTVEHAYCGHKSKCAQEISNGVDEW